MSWSVIGDDHWDNKTKETCTIDSADVSYNNDGLYLGKMKEKMDSFLKIWNPKKRVNGKLRTKNNYFSNCDKF